eukprot:scaffold8630_cov115-Isochrysis_galbana.AAC.13
MAPTDADVPATATDAQWEEARRLFDEQLARASTGRPMAKERYDLIVHALSRWDDMSAKQRLEMCNGNHNFWNQTYELSCGKTYFWFSISMCGADAR